MVKGNRPLSTEALSHHPLLRQFHDYQIRESHRAKHISIKVSTWGDVEVVVPRGVSIRKLASILKQRTDWIQETRQRVLSERGAIAHESEASYPAEVLLRAVGETWIVDYTKTDAPHVALDVDRTHCQLHISGHIEHPSLCHELLGQWIRDYARLHFTPWLESVSLAKQLPFNKCFIRRQKTRWASCSNKHNINLNDKLLFLPHDLVHYVFVHELCHTVHLDHSKKFWALVKVKEQQYESLDLQLRTAWRYVPRWIEK